MKHWISFLLAVLLCLPFAASCKEKTPPQPGNGTATAGSPSTAPESENVTEIETDEYGREVLESALPENLRYDNDRITVMVRSSHEQWFVGVNDKKATAIQQALYARDRRVEDRLKVRLDIKPVTQTGSDTKNYDQTVRAALSGAGEYDIITSYAYFTPTLAISGCFADMNGIRNLHMDTLCWNSDFADSVVFDGALYFNVGDFSLDYLGKLTTIYFNKNLAARYFGSSDVIYDMVDDGSWTLGNVGALVKEIYTDLNSNGAQDMIGKYGKKKVFGTHLNDNMGVTGEAITWLDDAHMLPFDGVVDWNGIAARLKRAEFRGDLTFELIQGNRPGRRTNDRYVGLSQPEYLTLAHDRAVRFAALMEA